MTTATKGADLDRRMYALGPTALADEAASLLWDDGRRSLYEGDAAGCDAAAAPGLTPLQRDRINKLASGNEMQRTVRHDSRQLVQAQRRCMCALLHRPREREVCTRIQRKDGLRALLTV